jgi:hypothetical protein
MATVWSCPTSDCPPTKIAPVDVPESGEGGSFSYVTACPLSES